MSRVGAGTQLHPKHIPRRPGLGRVSITIDCEGAAAGVAGICRPSQGSGRFLWG